MSVDLTTVHCIIRYVSNYYRYEMTPVLATSLRDSLSRGQTMSKLSLIKLAHKHIVGIDDAFFVGHWHGLLPLIFHEYKLIKSARGIELDPFWVGFSNNLNNYWDWQSTEANADTYAIPKSGIIVNTSCEHMTDNWINTIEDGTIVCAQSTDFVHPTHVNTVQTLDEFLKKWEDFTILDSSADKYDLYTRFTVIAKK